MLLKCDMDGHAISIELERGQVNSETKGCLTGHVAEPVTKKHEVNPKMA
jgi:hypothetical protein